MSINLPMLDRQVAGEVIKTVNGRDLRDQLQVTKDYTSWAKAQIKRARFVENEDFVVFTQKGENSPAGRPSVDYHFTVEAAKHIGMLSGTVRGKEVRDYFIACERATKSQAPAIKDPHIAAAILALTRIDQVEQEQQRQGMEIARIAENVAVIEARTQPENKHFTVMGYANLIGLPMDVRTASGYGRRCAALSRERGLIIGDVSDPRFGAVHSYHESVLLEVLQRITEKA